MNDIVEARGKVIAIDDLGIATIRLERQTSCAQCGSRGTCAPDKTTEHTVNLRLTGNARVGEDVTVSTSSASIVFAAFLGYALPAFCLLIGAIAGGTFFGGDGAAVVGAALGVTAGLLGARAVTNAAPGNALSTRAILECEGPTFQPGEYR